MDHSEEEDSKLPAVPQQQQVVQHTQQQQQQSWGTGEPARGYIPQQPQAYLPAAAGQAQGVASYAQPPPPQQQPLQGVAVLPSQQQQQSQMMYHQHQVYPSYGAPQQQAAAYPATAAGLPRQGAAAAAAAASQQQQPMYYHPPQQPQLPPQHQQPTAAPVGVAPHISYPAPHQQQQQQAPAPPTAASHPFIQPNVGRLPKDRPLVKLSVSLIDTYKHINTVYYEERDARRAARAKEKGGGKTGTTNNGWDDENYDYIVTQGELFYGRYKIRERIGKGSFGQVVRAEDVESKRDVAIKIIKSKKPFLMQAKTEIELLTHMWEKDPEDQHNIGEFSLSGQDDGCFLVFVPRFPVGVVSHICFTFTVIHPVRLLTHFMYRNHQCLVFEMLSLNLYELLKNTQFGGVSLNLIRKFAKQVLKALLFLARKDVDIIHCDLKPENILLRHPKKSGVKVIDFGSSCRSNKRMYSYIQSRFYRSPEVMLGLPYSVAIDMWSLGCILVEMHTGEPLFSGSDQFDQMQKIVKMLGMVPGKMLDNSGENTKSQFFERVKTPSGQTMYQLRQTKKPGKSSESSASSSPDTKASAKEPITPSTDPIASLTEVITSGSRQKKKFPPSEAHNSPKNYALFIDLVNKMLAYDPAERIKPEDALNHPFIVDQPPVTTTGSAPAAQGT